MANLSTFPTLRQSTKDASPDSKRRRFVVPSQLAHAQSTTDSLIEKHTPFSSIFFERCAQSHSQVDIEAGLLQVGMRVRKSVADGYQVEDKQQFTSKTCWSEPTRATGGGTLPVDFRRRNLALTPYATAMERGAVSGLISQTTPISMTPTKTWTYTTTHKRAYQVDDGEDEELHDTSFDAWSDGGSFDSSRDTSFNMPGTPTESDIDMPSEFFDTDVEIETLSDVSPFTRRTSPFRPVAIRKMVVPKSRKLGVTGTDQRQPSNLFAMPHETGNSNTFSWAQNNMSSPFDFGEATFLRKQEDIDFYTCTDMDLS